jgi:hypothetical protein
VPSVIAAEVVGTARLELLPLAVTRADAMAVVLSDPAPHAFTGGAPERRPSVTATGAPKIAAVLRARTPSEGARVGGRIKERVEGRVWQGGGGRRPGVGRRPTTT